MQKQEIKFVNAEALIVFFLCFPAVPVCYFAFPGKNHYAILFFLFVPFFFTILLNKWHLFDYARINILLTAEISLFGAVSIFGKECNLQYIFIIIAFASVITFQNNGKKSLVFILGIAAILLSFIYASDFSLFHQERLTPFQTEIIKFTGLLLCFLSSVVIAFFYVSKFSSQRQTIEKHNRELEYQKTEIERQNTVLNQKSLMIEYANAELQEKNLALEQLNLEKNEFLGIVAHDLKNPLSAIHLGAKLMHDNTEELRGEDVREISGDILMTSIRMFNLITNLLDVNKLENNAMTFSPANVDVVPLLRRSVVQYTPQAEAKALRFSTDCAAESVIAFVDESATMQVIDNIVSNAVKYSPRGKNIFISLQSSEDVVRVEVRDEGPGISKEDMNKLFGKFARLSAQPTGGEHSTGLGLSIVKKMVEAMHGRVWCESELGKGATFIIELRAQ